MASPVSKEITELHVFFQEWFRGNVPDDDMSRVSQALHAEFTWISPWGTMLSKDELIHRIMPVFGTRPEMVIEIRNIHEIPLSATHILAHYEEWQRHDEFNMGRISTAIFLKEAASPNGVSWFHLQETMLPAPDPE